MSLYYVKFCFILIVYVVFYVIYCFGILMIVYLLCINIYFKIDSLYII